MAYDDDDDDDDDGDDDECPMISYEELPEKNSNVAAHICLARRKLSRVVHDLLLFTRLCNARKFETTVSRRTGGREFCRVIRWIYTANTASS